MYEGQSINKLQNSIILPVFLNIKEILNVRFVGHLILNTSCKF